MFLIALPLAALIGFSLNRASICSVRAVAEVLHARQGHMLLAIARSALWVEFAVLLLLWLSPWPSAAHPAWTLNGLALAGGFLFGIGAALNGGCALSTVSRFGDGEVAMLVTLASMVLAAAAFDFAFRPLLTGLQPMVMTWPPPQPLLGLLAAALAVWACYEAARIWRMRKQDSGIRRALLAGSYRLSAAALVIGLCNGVLYYFEGPWSFTSAVDRELRHRFGLGEAAPIAQWLLLLALLGGAALSAAQRRRFRLDWKPRAAWLHHLAGGALMGVGASLTPGGNDALILQAAPSLSPHALPALAAMLCGILGVLLLRRAGGRALPRIRCVDDYCVEEPHRPPVAG